MSKLREVDDYVLSLEDRGNVRRILPSFVAKKTGASLEEVNERLVQWVEMGYLEIEYEVRCLYTGETLCYEKTKHPSSLFGLSVECSECGEEHIVTPQMVFPTFLPISKGDNYSPKKFPPSTGRTNFLLTAMQRSSLHVSR